MKKNAASIKANSSRTRTRFRTRKTRYMDRHEKRSIKRVHDFERSLEEHDAIERACESLDPALACEVYGKLHRRGFTDRGIGRIVQSVTGWGVEEFDALMRGEDVKEISRA